jgi:choline dehydrogenase-like flavoprotein
MPIQLARRKDASYALQFTSDQVPNPDSRSLLSNQLDPFGMRRLGVLWRAGDEDRLTITHAYRLLASSLADDRRVRVEISDDEMSDVAARATPSGGHHLGAARMSSSAAHGVVDSDLRVRGTRGLYVASAAVFPTSGTANPTLTIVALSLRLAEFLVKLIGT